jgi:transcriptional regulator
MFIHPHDRVDDEDRWRAFLVRQGFGHLVAAGSRATYPVVVPTQFVLDGDVILTHVLARNPILAALADDARAVLSVAGDWAFIPGAWKAIGDEDPRKGIPTTYYGAVQVSGSCVIEDQPAAIADVLRRQVAATDPDGDYIDPLEHGAKLNGIRGLRLTIEEVRAKFKYGGNVDQAHRDAVRAHLLARNEPGDVAAVQHLDLIGPRPSRVELLEDGQVDRTRPVEPRVE